MRIIDPAWVGAKLRSLLDFAEPMGDFFAPVPGSKKQSTYPSTVAYIAKLLTHRYAMLGILDDEGFPVKEAGLMDANYQNVVKLRIVESSPAAATGQLCPDCATYNVVKRDGCRVCERCFWQGDCG